MQFLLFDVLPHADRVSQYLDIAAALRPELDASGGCLFLDRFRRVDDPGWLLSFQIWRDEAAIDRWRAHAGHHAAQLEGRARVFDDYRIRVGCVVAEHDATAASPVHPDPQADGRYVVLAESVQGAPVAGDGSGRRFASLYRDGQSLEVLEAPGFAGALALATERAQAAGFLRWRVGRVERDYSMRRRSEAPQQFGSQD